MQLHYRIGALALLVLLAACGGKGGDDAPPAAAIGPVVPVASTLEFPLKAAHDILVLLGDSTATLYAKGTAETASVNGQCTGTLVLAATPINYPQVFDGVSRQFAINTVRTGYSNCPGAGISETVFNYYDYNYLPLGSSRDGIYGMWPAPATYPVSVTVGMSGTIGTEQFYVDATRTTPLGRMEYSYVVEPDTASSAIVNLITKRFDAAGQLQYTVQERRRIRQDTFFNVVSWERQDAVAPNLHVIFRR